MGHIKFRNTWKIICLIDTLREIKELKDLLDSSKFSTQAISPEWQEKLENLKSFLKLYDILEDVLKRACVISFIAEFEYYLINIIGHPKFEKKTKKNLRKNLLRELKYKNIKDLFEKNFWTKIEGETIEFLKGKHGKFFPKELYPFDDFVEIRNNYLAHISNLDSDQHLIELETLKRTIEYMEILLSNLQSKT